MGFSDPRPASDAASVIVVGAGLAGLACAVHLHEAGRRCVVLEASDDVGGRVRTDVVDGFRLDRGFQVLPSAYPEARELLDLDALDLRAFRPGALVRRKGRFHLLGDPYRKPLQSLRTLTAPVGSLSDKLRVAVLRAQCRRGTLDEQMERPESSTLEALQRAGISSSMIDGFLRPFLGGIFLEPELETSTRMFRFVFRMFARGDATVPAEGMGEIPRQLARRLPDGTLRLGARVDRLAPGRVVLEGGEAIPCEQVVVATDGSTAHRLIEGVREPEWNAVSCVYFAAERAPVREPILVLDGEAAGPVNNLCFPTQVSPTYGPPGRTLVSATAIGADAGREDLEGRMLVQLSGWFGAKEVGGWRHLRTYRIARALPRQSPGWLDPVRRAVRCGRGIYVAGDHVETASTNGALGAGRRAAQALLEDLEAR